MDNPLLFEGIVHPPPRPDQAKADLDEADIQSWDLGARPNTYAQTRLLVEHTGDPVGSVLASWQGPDGSMRVCGSVRDDSVCDLVREGVLRGLSLGQGMYDFGQKALPLRLIDEVSLCAEGARPGTWITRINGDQVSPPCRRKETTHALRTASNNKGTPQRYSIE